MRKTLLWVCLGILIAAGSMGAKCTTTKSIAPTSTNPLDITQLFEGPQGDGDGEVAGD